MVRLTVGNDYLELEDEDLFYNMRVNDIFELSKVAASWTNVFNAPKNQHNTKVLEGLGLVGNTSTMPYKKIPADLVVEGYTIIKNGWFNVSQVTDYYYVVHILNGITDFFKAIENGTLGKSLDLKEINHTKDLNTVADSMDNENYRYIISDYGGKTQLANGINIDYLAPSARVKYLWDKIFNTFGFTYSGSIFQNEDFSNLWITYPKAVEKGGSGGINVGRLSVPSFTVTKPEYRREGNYLYFDFVRFEGDIQGFTKIDHNVFKANETKDYRLDMTLRGYVKFVVPSNLSFTYSLVVRAAQTIQHVDSAVKENEDPNKNLILKLNKGDIISFHMTSRGINNGTPPTSLQNDYLEISFQELSSGQADFTSALDGFALKDFVKEIIWNFGLIPIIDTQTKHIVFYTIEERLNIANAIDWSDKYVSRTKEIYMNAGYAQENIFRYKYNEQEDTFNDGSIRVNNKNLPDNKITAASKMYSPEQGITEIRPVGDNASKIEVSKYPIWKAEVKENRDGTIGIEYKSLSGRFYFLKSKNYNQSIRFKSESLGNETTRMKFAASEIKDSTFKELVPKYYGEYKRVLEDFKIHEIELKLTYSDIINLDFSKPYYFEQEASYYLLNTLQWSTSGECQGEFVRLKK